MFAGRRPIPETELPASFEELGYHVRDNGVLEANDGITYKYRTFKNERADELYQESLQKAARHHVKTELEEVYHIREVHIKGSKIDTTKRKQPYVPILTTNLEELRNKDEVIIFCGDHNLELGVLSRPGIIDERGINRSSVLDFVAYACMTSKMHNFKHKVTVNHDLVKAHHLSTFDMGHKVYPGIIILNPGQLIYSHETNQTYSHRSWLARAAEHTSPDTRTISNKYNFIPGHSNPDEHVETFFKDVLQTLIKPKAKLCIIGIGRGAESVVLAIDSIIAQHHLDILYRQLGFINLIGTTHKHSQLTSPHFKRRLERFGVGYVLHDEASKGKIVAIPERMPAKFYSNALCITDKPIAAPVPVPQRHLDRTSDAYHTARDTVGYTAEDNARDLERSFDANSAATVIRRPRSSPSSSNLSLAGSAAIDDENTPVRRAFRSSGARRDTAELSPSMRHIADLAVAEARRREQANVARQTNSAGSQTPEQDADLTLPRLRRSHGTVTRASSMASPPSLISDHGTITSGPSFETRSSSLLSPPSLATDHGTMSGSSELSDPFLDEGFDRMGLQMLDTSSEDTSRHTDSIILRPLPRQEGTSVISPRTPRTESSFDRGFADDYLNHPDPRFRGTFRQYGEEMHWSAHGLREYPTNCFHREYADYDEDVSCTTLAAGKDVTEVDDILHHFLPQIMMDLDDMRTKRVTI